MATVKPEVSGPDSRGYYFRSIGWKKTRGGNRTQHKFLLGRNKQDAVKRVVALQTLWSLLEIAGHTEWNEVTLHIASHLARGESEVPIAKPPGMDDKQYGMHLHNLRHEYRFLTFVFLVPEDPDAYEAGASKVVDMVATIRATEEELAEEGGQLAAALLGSTDTHAATLHQAMGAFIKWIEGEYHDAQDGHLTDYGKTKIRQVQTLMKYLANRPLRSLDYEACDGLFAVFRNRPQSEKGEPMAVKSCQIYIGELGRFFRWLHLSSDYSWRMPQDFSFISRKVRELDADSEGDPEVPVFTIEQLTIINRYCRPLERALFYVALNCAFGVDQLGRLKVGEIQFGEKSTRIRRIRRKKKVKGLHLLWAPTVEMIRWAIERREKQPDFGPKAFLFLNGANQPYWRKTSGGNRVREIPNMWSRLLDRIEKDHPGFPRHGFNTLRDTSADLVRRIAGGEIASIHLTHKHNTDDENLGRYSNPPRKRHFRALRVLERRLEGVFAAVEDPFFVQPKAYTSQGKHDRIVRMYRDGAKVAQIADAVGRSRQTIYRHLKAAGEM